MTNLHVSLKLVITLLVWFAFLPQSFAKTVRYELTVRNEKVNLSGKKTVDFALTVNGGIPAPALEFTEGDDAEILVKNALAKEEVSIHWHGLLLPPEEDGVAYVNTPPIHPGTSRLFKFKLRQNGTYWYHSHTAVQEQKGVYGAFIIHPKKKAIAYDKDAVLVLSDWSDENADQIIRNLRKDGDFYLYKKNSVRSYIGAIKAGGLKTHLQNEWTRMGGMDLSDVGYDAFLINGKRDSQLLVAHPGEKIRLRIINAGASSYFYVSMGIPMQVIAADGVDTKPVMANEILMGMAETYDVLFTVPDHKNYEIRATAQDVTGFASAWIGMGERVSAPDKPQPDLYASMDHMGHGASGMPGMDHSKMKGMDHSSMSGMDHSPMSGMDHTKMSHSTHVSNETSVETTHGQHEGHQMSKTGETQNIDVAHDPHQGHQMSHDAPQIDPHTAHSMHSSASTKPSDTDSVIDRSLEISPINFESQSDAVLKQNATPRDFKDGSKVPVVETLTVDSLKALTTTTLPKNAKIHDLKLVLGGDMVRYIWHINGKAISQDRLLMINEGEIVRFTFQNDTMMHHPMHLHGHFFRVINENGDRSPLKHTVDVPPHGTRTIEFYANEPGQWMLHCHNLYHMKTGMARVVRYSDFKLTPDMEKYDKHDPHLHDHLYTYSRVEGGSNHAQLEARVMRTWDALNLRIESADIDGKNFSSGKDWYTEGDLFYERWFGRFIHAFGGGSIYDQKGYGTVGFGMILPLLVQSDVSINHEGLFRLDLDKRFQWTKNIFSDAEFSWRPGWGGERDTEYEVSLMYGPSWAWSAGLMATEKSVGIGAQIQF